MPIPSKLPLLMRFLDQKEAARERLAASRARADLLDRVWPDLPASHPGWCVVLLQLVEHQAEAGLEPRPLWDLIDLLSRPQLEEAASANNELEQRLTLVLEHEVAKRIAHVPPVGLTAVFDSLLGKMSRPDWRRASLDGLWTSLRRQKSRS